MERSAFEFAASAATINALLDAAGGPLDLVLITGGPGLLVRGGAVELLGTLRPACSIVIVGHGDDRALVRKALRAGVAGFVPEREAEHALAATICAVLAGQLSIPRSIRDRASWTEFSPRERQVLELVASGLTNRQIAQRLYLSQSTVKTHLSSSFRKLGVCSRAEAAAAVLDRENAFTQ